MPEIQPRYRVQRSKVWEDSFNVVDMHTRTRWGEFYVLDVALSYEKAVAIAAQREKERSV